MAPPPLLSSRATYDVSSVGDVIARVLVTASIIVCMIPTLFFVIIAASEANMIIQTLKTYVTTRCTLMRPWIPAGVTSSDIMSTDILAPNVDEHNAYLRKLAFASTIVILAVLLSCGLLIWVYFGKQPLLTLFSRVFFYCFLFAIVEVAFVLIITRMPLINMSDLDVVVLDHLIATGRSCGVTPA